MSPIKIDTLGVRYGLYTAAALIGYFLLMQLVGLAYILELRLFNLLIVIGGIVLALDRYRSVTNEHMEYLTGYGIGSSLTVVAVGIFTLFLGFYLSFDHAFMQHIKDTALMGSYLDPSTAAFAVLGEGLSSGVIGSFALMQWYKRYTPQTD
ncbi:MAG: hypothetical protein V4616_00150 [Bacteroidota bacterium]